MSGLTPLVGVDVYEAESFHAQEGIRKGYSAPGLGSVMMYPDARNACFNGVAVRDVLDRTCEYKTSYLRVYGGHVTGPGDNPHVLPDLTGGN